LRLDTGPQVTGKELAVSHEGLMDRQRPLSRITALLYPQDLRWRSDIDAAVGKAVTEFAAFTEGTITRVDRTELWRLPATLLPDDPKSGNKGLQYLTDQLCGLGGACEPRHVVRNDPGPMGTIVTAARLQVPGQKQGRECFFVESTVTTGVGDSSHRRLEVIAADHPNLLAVVNGYSYEEWLQARDILNLMDLHPEIRKEVLAQAGRLTAPDAQTLDMLVKGTVHAYDEAETARLAAAEGETRRVLYMGVAATAEALIFAASHQKVVI